MPTFNTVLVPTDLIAGAAGGGVVGREGGGGGDAEGKGGGGGGTGAGNSGPAKITQN